MLFYKFVHCFALYLFVKISPPYQEVLADFPEIVPASTMCATAWRRMDHPCHLDPERYAAAKAEFEKMAGNVRRSIHT